MLEWAAALIKSTVRYLAGEDWQRLVHKTKPAVVRLGADDFAGKVFTGKVSEPVYVDKVALDKVDETLEKYEKEMVKLNHETAIIVTKEGKAFSVVGEEGSVYFCNVGEDALNGATVTHNHPAKLTRYSFSKFDLGELMDLRLKRIRGIDNKFIYEIITDENTKFVDYQVIVHVSVGLVCQYVRRHGAVYPEPALQAVALFHLRPVHVGVNHAQAYRNICGQRSRLIRPCVPSGRTETPHQGNRHGQ